MNRFSYYQATTIEDALKEANATVSETIQAGPKTGSSVLKASGIDLLDLMKEGIAQPDKMVNIRNMESLSEISWDDKKGMRLGATVTLAAIAKNPEIKSHFFALHQSASKAATPQIRNMATLGGNLAQRTRCWYFRSKDHVCYRKGSITCFAQIGQNQYHSIMKNEDCASVHSSTISTALMALNAAVEITDQKGQVKIIPITEFFVTPDQDRTKENILKFNELITAVLIPPLKKNAKSHYLKMGERESHDWPIADVAVMVEYSGKRCKAVNIVLGAAAPVPIRMKSAEELLKGKVIDEETASAAGIEAMKKATPLSMNAYKIPIFETLIKRALLATT